MGLPSELRQDSPIPRPYCWQSFLSQARPLFGFGPILAFWPIQQSNNKGLSLGALTKGWCDNDSKGKYEPKSIEQISTGQANGYQKKIGPQ